MRENDLKIELLKYIEKTEPDRGCIAFSELRQHFGPDTALAILELKGCGIVQINWIPEFVNSPARIEAVAFTEIGRAFMRDHAHKVDQKYRGERDEPFPKRNYFSHQRGDPMRVTFARLGGPLRHFDIPSGTTVRDFLDLMGEAPSSGVRVYVDGRWVDPNRDAMLTDEQVVLVAPPFCAEHF